MPKKHGAAVSISGEGYFFERNVGAYYLATLLLQAPPLGLDRGVLKEVSFQQGALEHPLDDLVVTSDTPQGEATLALQIKRDISFSATDGTFQKVMRQAWEEFTRPKFKVGLDRMGFVIALSSKVVDEHYRPVFSWAQDSNSAQDFLEKLDKRTGLTGKPMRRFVGLMRAQLAIIAKGDVGDEPFWKFCKSMVILQFDFLNRSSKDRQTMIELLKRVMPNAASERAWNSLLLFLREYAEDGMRHVGRFDYVSLRDRLLTDGFALEPAEAPKGEIIQNLPGAPVSVLYGTVGGPQRDS